VWLDVHGGRVCRNMSVCDRNSQYQAVPANYTRDRVCRNFMQCHPATQYELVPGSNVSDRVCAALSVCDSRAREVRPAHATSDRVCECNSGYWGSGTTCTAWATCSAHGGVKVNGTATTDRVCGCLNQHWGDGVSCWPWRSCGALAVQTGLPSATTDRACRCNSGYFSTPVATASVEPCQPHTQCGVASRELYPPSATADRVCICTAGYWLSPGSSTGNCTAWKACSAAANEEDDPSPTLAPNATMDRTCRCMSGFWRSGNQQGAACQRWTSCSQRQAVGTAGTAVTDTVCSCGPGWEAAATSAPADCSGDVCPRGCGNSAAATRTCSCACGYGGGGGACTVAGGAGTTACAGAVLELRLTRDIAGIELGTAARTQFEADFKTDVAGLAGIVPERVTIESIWAGSIVVKFRITSPPLDPNGKPTIAAAVSNLQSRLASAGTTTVAGTTVAAGASSLTVVQAGPAEPVSIAPSSDDDAFSSGEMISAGVLVVMVAGLACVALRCFIKRRSHHKAEKTMDRIHSERYLQGTPQPLPVRGKQQLPDGDDDQVRAPEQVIAGSAASGGGGGAEAAVHQGAHAAAAAAAAYPSQQHPYPPPTAAAAAAAQHTPLPQRRQPPGSAQQPPGSAQQPSQLRTNSIRIQLVLGDTGTTREVDLERIVTTHQLLDHIVQSGLAAPASELHYMGHALTGPLSLGEYGLEDGSVIVVRAAGSAAPPPPPPPMTSQTRVRPSTPARQGPDRWGGGGGRATAAGPLARTPRNRRQPGGAAAAAAAGGGGAAGALAPPPSAEGAGAPRTASSSGGGGSGALPHTAALKSAKAAHGAQWPTLSVQQKQAAVLDASAMLTGSGSSSRRLTASQTSRLRSVTPQRPTPYASAATSAAASQLLQQQQQQRDGPLGRRGGASTPGPSSRGTRDLRAAFQAVEALKGGSRRHNPSTSGVMMATMPPGGGGGGGGRAPVQGGAWQPGRRRSSSSSSTAQFYGSRHHDV
jgi:hypothetical protein